MSKELLDPSQIGTSKRIKTKTVEKSNNAVKYVRLVQITGLILATLLLTRQSFTYSQVCAFFVGVTTAERVWALVFRGK